MIFSYLLNMQSHPSWVCGLKLPCSASSGTMPLSHPSWVCGLKPFSFKCQWLRPVSHPSWVCGLKLHTALIYNLDESHTLRGCVD